MAKFCHKNEKVFRKKANVKAENSLRDRSYTVNSKDGNQTV